MKSIIGLVALALVGVTMAWGDLDDGLVLHYSFDVLNGSEVPDESGQGHTGTVSGALSEPVGVGSAALLFDGIDDYVTVTDNDDLDFGRADSFSMACWARSDGLGSGGTEAATLLVKDSGLGDYYRMDLNHGGEGVFRFSAGARDPGMSQDVVAAIPDYQQGTWFHLAAVKNASNDTVTLYVDGNPVVSATDTTSVGWVASSGDVLVGDTTIFSPDRYAFDGIMDELRIYDRALAGPEVMELANASMGRQPDLVLSYSFDQDLGPTEPDQSTYGNDGAIVGPLYIADGVVGGARRFDGIDDIIDVGSPESLDLVGPFSMFCWVRVNDASDPEGSALSRDNGVQRQTSLGVNGNAGPLYYEFQGAGGVGAGSILFRGILPALAYGEWHHLGIVFDGQRFKAYRDGEVLTQAIGVALPSAPAAKFLVGGRDYPGGFNGLKGDIDEVRVYRTALSELEVLGLYAQGAVPPCPPAAPGQNDFDGDGVSDPAVYDPLTGVWYINYSTQGFATTQFGFFRMTPVTGDFDGDGTTDLGGFDPITGIWYLLQSSDGFLAQPFGYAGVTPVTGDYDGDGETDIGVFDPVTGWWFYLMSTDGFVSSKFGFNRVVPIGGVKR